MYIKEENVRQTLGNLINMFESGSLPEAVALKFIKPLPGHERPCDSWSLSNWIIMLANGTYDARGFRQWNKIGRGVKKGAKAFYILAPQVKKAKVKKIDEATGKEEEVEVIVKTTFRAVPVFRMEDTEGLSMEEFQYMPPNPPPLYELAERMQIKLDYMPKYSNSPGGYFDLENKTIMLHTYDIRTWFHELGHALHSTFRELQTKQVPEQELVAELFAATMCELYGEKGYHLHSWNYIKAYCENNEELALKTIVKVLSDVEKCLSLVELNQ